MASKSPWVVAARFFKQSYEGGYRYLDRCGEFMLLAEEKFNFVPSEEARPTGCAMHLPEIGTEMLLNTVELTLRQSGQGAEKEGSEFYLLLLSLPLEVQKLIAPRAISRNGLAITLFKRLSEEESFKQIRGAWGDFESNLADKIGMNPEFKNIDFLFTSGSYRVNVKLNPASIRSPATSQQVAQFRDTPAKKEQIKRRNAMNQ